MEIVEKNYWSKMKTKTLVSSVLSVHFTNSSGPGSSQSIKSPFVWEEQRRNPRSSLSEIPVC